MERAVRVLYCAPDDGDRRATVERLERADDRISATVVGGIAAAEQALTDRAVDCVVSATELADGGWLALFRATDLPFVLLNDQGPETAQRAFEKGVADVVPFVDGAADVLADRLARHATVDDDPAGTERRGYHAFIDNVPGLVYRSSVDDLGAFESVYGRAAAVCGYSGDQFEAGLNWLDEVVHPNDRAQVSRRVERATAQGERFEVTYRIQTADGAVSWVTDRGWTVDATAGVVEGLILDVTAQTEGERQLEREHRRFSDLFSNFPEPTVAYGFEDGTTVFRQVNAAFESLFGLAADEVRGESVNELLVPEKDRPESDEIDRQVEGGEMVDLVVTRVAADGPRIFNLRSIPVESGGEIDGFAVYRDITERRQRERELERQNERLEEFASIVSHDLRNPLNVAKGHLDLALREYEDDSLQTVQSALDRMEALIAETLDLARQGEMVTETEAVSLAEVATGCWEMVQTSGARLDVETDATIQGDRERVKQLFENLFRNAVDHAGTDVALTVGPLDEGFYVADNGPGIPPESHEEVFEVGFTTSDDGTGFGLPIVNTIVEAHNWSIAVTESETGGARFEITGVSTA